MSGRQEGKITRRGALGAAAKRAAAAAVGVALLDRLPTATGAKPASTGPAKPFAFALISDTHLGRGGGEKPADQMRRAVDEINASPAELVICCGDLVNAGEVPGNEKQYPNWLKIAGGLRPPWHAIPGNHDPVEKFTHHVRGETDFVVDAGPFRFICFRDAKPNPDHQGIVTAAQIEWLENQLTETERAGRRAMLVSHIIYHENPKPDFGWAIRDGREDFAALLKRHAPTVAAFFAGHLHSGLRGWDDTFGIHEVVLPSCCWNFDGKRLRGATGYVYDEDRPAWVLAEASASALKLSYRPIGADVSVVRELSLISPAASSP